MSTETVYVSSARDVQARDVRRRVAEAREARRRVAQERAERVAAEAARRRIVAANGRVAQEEAVFNDAVARLDDAARRLPDLAFKAPPLPTLTTGESADTAAVEAYADKVTAAVSLIVQQIDAAIAVAEIALQRRLAVAAAWREIQDSEHRVAACASSVAELEARLVVAPLAIESLTQPTSDAELETLQAYLGELQLMLGALQRRRESLEAQDNSRLRASELSGSALHARSAEIAHAEHQAELVTEIRAKRRAVLEAALGSRGLHLEHLGEATRSLIESTIEEASIQDRSEQIERWIAIEKQNLDGVCRSKMLMQQIPDHVHEDARLSQRWQRLAARLQRVANGIDEFLPDLDREYSQIEADAKRNRVTAYTKADWVCAMSAQGFKVLEPESGEGLVVVDLHNPDVWLRATEMQADNGGFAVMMELETDVDTTEHQDERITDSICHRLGQVKDANAPKVNSQGETLARDPRITRRGRPPTLVRQLSTKFD